MAGKMRHIFVLLALAACCASAFAAEKEPVTIELWGLVEARAWHGTFDAIREFERLHPHIRVKVGTPGGQGDLDPQKLLTAVVAGTPPDLLWFSRHALGMWASRGAFRPIDDLIARDGIDLNEYYPGLREVCMWEGKTYCLAWNIDGRVLFCNMPMLRAAGYDRPPRTWDELAAMAAAMTKYDERRGRYETLGFAPNYGNAWLYLYAWQNGAEWFSPDGRTAQVSSPPVLGALDWMVKTYDAVGGADRVQSFQSSAQIEGIGDPFLSGRLAMQFNGGYYLDTIARYKPDLDVEVSLPPAAKEGMEPVSWSGGFAWVLPKDSRHPEEAWTFSKWMCSEEAWRIITVEQQRFSEEEMGPGSFCLSAYSANRRVNEKVTELLNTWLPEKFQRANQVCLDVLPHCKHPPVSVACTELWDAQVTAMMDAIFHIRTPKEALDLQQRRVQSSLDRYHKPPAGPVLSPRAMAWWVAGIVALLLGAWAAWTGGRLRGMGGLERRRALEGMLCVTPWAAGFLLFMIGPMLFSAMIAFCRYDVIHPPEFTGAENWARMFGAHRDADGWRANDPLFWKGLWNTLYIVVFGVPLSMAASLLLAVLLNAKVRGIRAYRALLYVPVMVPAVVSAIVWIWMLNPETGFVNHAVNWALRPLGLSAPGWFSQPEWAKPGLILMLVWGCGGTVIIWLAGLQSLPRHVYEAAAMDGAGPVQRFFRITLPLLTPHALFIWIMGTIGALQIFTQAYIINAPGDSLLFYALYLFHRAFRYFEMGYASAMAWVLFVLTVAVCLWQMRVSRRWVHYEHE